jgi:hypothetical protein
MLIHDRERDLLDFLYKLGVTSADTRKYLTSVFTSAGFQQAVDASLSNFGAPDKIMINPRDLEAFQKLLR